MNTNTDDDETIKPEAHLQPEDDPEEFKIVNRRAFMATGNTKYLLPSDVEDLKGFSLFIYHMCSCGISKSEIGSITSITLSETELEKGIHVIDVGCGTGRWTLEMAEEYPNSVFVGIDCADVFPKYANLPNCSFMKANTLEGLPFRDNTEWRAAMRELARIAKPGGLIELMELALEIERPPPAFTAFYNGVFTTTTARGIDLSILQHLPELLTEAGLKNVQNETFPFPLGWRGTVSNLSLSGMVMFFASMKPAARASMGVSDDEYEDIARQCIKGFRERRSCIIGRLVHGQKPKE
ncbi:S-adenosyl-L-methionine-dependent methyltransferase [Endogone sp. FLAS-F59071]|nr:S-adenosyl-L-methionine-dependent methyltransferase [Endogone sp. FLAS-F59071]|eukprot:RUS22461.1 S-adenosyl-L-methionine-dependent methyltransferase [Endogone sp. FLAS-F59071]